MIVKHSGVTLPYRELCSAVSSLSEIRRWHIIRQRSNSLYAFCGYDLQGERRPLKQDEKRAKRRSELKKIYSLRATAEVANPAIKRKMSNTVYGRSATPLDRKCCSDVLRITSKTFGS